MKEAVKIPWWHVRQGFVAKPLPQTSQASIRPVVITTDRLVGREDSLANEGWQDLRGFTT